MVLYTRSAISRSKHKPRIRCISYFSMIFFSTSSIVYKICTLTLYVLSDIYKGFCVTHSLSLLLSQEFCILKHEYVLQLCTLLCVWDKQKSVCFHTHLLLSWGNGKLASDSWIHMEKSRGHYLKWLLRYRGSKFALEHFHTVVYGILRAMRRLWHPRSQREQNMRTSCFT